MEVVRARRVFCGVSVIVLLTTALLLSSVGRGDAAGASGAEPQWREIRPDSGAKVEVVIEGARRTYALLASGTGVEVEVEGPARLRARTRLLLGDARGEDYRYSVRVSGDDGSGEKVFPLRCEASRKRTAVGTGGPRIGQAKSFAFDVPAGKHRYTFAAADPPGARVAVRFHSRAKEGKVAWESVSPKTHGGACDLVPRGQLTRYYSLPQNGELTLKASGPARIRVWSRLSFTDSMLGDVHYSLRIARDGGEAQVVPLIARRSSKSIYIDRPDLVPAEAEKFEFDVPAGDHEYRLRLVSSSAPRVTLRFSKAEVR
jgi:hypothetical protein